MPQAIKFYTDEHVARAVVRGLRARGVDVITATEAGMSGSADVEHLKRAAAESRVVLTQDHDFLHLHAQGIQHNGIAYAPQRSSIGDVIRWLMLIHQVLSAEEMRGRVEFLQR